MMRLMIGKPQFSIVETFVIAACVLNTKQHEKPYCDHTERHDATPSTRSAARTHARTHACTHARASLTGDETIYY